MSWKKRLSLATALVTLAAVPAGAKTLEMTSVYPGSFPIVGDIGKDIGNRVSTLTGGSLTFTFNEPGALVPAPEAWDAVSTGAVDARFASDIAYRRGRARRRAAGAGGEASRRISAPH